MIDGPDNHLINQSLKFKFKFSNNQAEYESFIADMVLSLEMDASSLKFRSNSYLVANQVIGEY